MIEISPWRGEDDPYKFGVRVKWDRTGHINLSVALHVLALSGCHSQQRDGTLPPLRYRWGASDKFDLEVIGYSDKEVGSACCCSSCGLRFTSTTCQKARAMRPKPAIDPPTFALDKSALLEIFESSDGRRWAYKKAGKTQTLTPVGTGGVVSPATSLLVEWWRCTCGSVHHHVHVA